MSGHSHFKTVKATKDANDAKKGKIFSKLGRVITIAAKEKGGDIALNVKLKGAIERAKEFNMPKENIERAIKKGTGELAGESLESISFEGFGPGQIAIIINFEGKSKKELELVAIESGADDIIFKDTNLHIYTKPEDLENTKKTLEEKGLKIEESNLSWIPKEEITIDKKTQEKAQKLFEALDENDAVQDIYYNLKD